MPGELKKHYVGLARALTTVVRESTTTSLRTTRLGEAHGTVEDMELWLGVLVGRPEREVLEMAVREYRLSLLYLTQGQYRAAFASLRLFLELSLATVYFSGHELYQRQWMAPSSSDAYDLRWGVLSDENAGPLSKPFIKAFCPELCELANQYRALANSVYRDCSEYVHGNWRKMAVLPGQVAFDQAGFDTWIAAAAVVARITQFALTARYLKFLEKTAIVQIEVAVRGDLNHVASVRDLLDDLTK